MLEQYREDEHMPVKSKSQGRLNWNDTEQRRLTLGDWKYKSEAVKWE